MAIRAIRGATRLTDDSIVEMEAAVMELLSEMVTRNSANLEQLVSVIFTATPDILCGFPAAAARKLGWRDVPLICSVEMNVAHALPLVVRVMMHLETDLGRSEIQHVYLRGADVLRLDIAQ